MMNLFSKNNEFIITIEVVPPEGNNPEELLGKLSSLANLSFHAFSVASNPVAKPKMSAMVFTHLIQKATQKPAILHCTIRDHNRLGLQSELWGAKALGIDTVIAVTGDPSASKSEMITSTVGDLNVFELITMARDSDLYTGCVLDFRPEVNGLEHEAKRLEKKVASGCRFIVTQPVYDEKTAKKIHAAAGHLKVPVIMGILPLLSYKHAVFLHDRVDGIAVPKPLRQQMEKAKDPVKEGVAQARSMLELAKKMYSGACIMPPFDRFDILKDILIN
ncbi:MAG: homocysteine methyltransferase [Desulfobacula sp.]|jgi:methylenetetrahydrofolate reductase (NADPH)|uniref:methylenetetrahydrofolate reductase n=1 Tax=Desulfobacula sp. TaxID=2593537 RepID=UPI001D3A9FBE|nr:homocysteine methyltransferase [Desulfobacula sp.]MBT7260681.1 homocysteine methyltransferase [Desulfobacula sp.]